LLIVKQNQQLSFFNYSLYSIRATAIPLLSAEKDSQLHLRMSAADIFPKGENYSACGFWNTSLYKPTCL